MTAEQGLRLKINRDDGKHILLEVYVDEEITWSIAIHDERDAGLADDPVLCVYTEDDDDPKLILHKEVN